MHRGVSFLFIFLVGCASPTITDRPGTTCDWRVLALNEQRCIETKGTFVRPPDTKAPCGECR